MAHVLSNSDNCLVPCVLPWHWRLDEVNVYERRLEKVHFSKDICLSNPFPKPSVRRFSFRLYCKPCPFGTQIGKDYCIAGSPTMSLFAGLIVVPDFHFGDEILFLALYHANSFTSSFLRFFLYKSFLFIWQITYFFIHITHLASNRGLMLRVASNKRIFLLN